MSILQLNLGTYPNDGQGDDLRTAFQKTIDNFEYLDLVKIEDGENLGTSQLNTHGVYASKEDTTLLFKSIKQGDNVTITSDGNTITIRPKDSINAVEEDPDPKLGGDLNTAGYDIYSLDAPLNIYVENEGLTLFNLDTETGDYLTLGLNGLSILGGNLLDSGTNVISTFIGDSLTVTADEDLTLVANNGNVLITGEVVADSSISAEAFLGPLIGNVLGNVTGELTGNVTGNVLGNVTGNITGNLTGNVTGELTGNVTGNVLGNVTGQVSSITNHNLQDLNDVVSTTPLLNQVLTWTGSNWAPQTITSGVSKIIAGNNITISPSNGLGEVTINATGSGSITEINTFDFGNFTNTFTNPITYLLNQVGVDFGSFTAPSQFTIDLGSF